MSKGSLKAVKSRQVIRREFAAMAMAQVNSSNLRRVGDSCRGMLRKERRNLMRAYAAKQWRTFQQSRFALAK